MMNKYCFWLLSIFVFCLYSLSVKAIGDKERYVVVLSMDGFRSDYIERTHTPTFDSIAGVGVKAGFRPSFPSVTFSNHYSMATGLFPDHHGLVNNDFYAPDLQKVYHKGDTDGRFFGGEPIWNTSERQRVKSAVFYWVGSDYPINGRQASYWKPYDKKVSYAQRADTVLKWLSLPETERPHLVMWYVEEPDGIGHVATPDSIATLNVVGKLDSFLGDFLSKARALDIYEDIDFIVVSDHGMATFTPQTTIHLEEYMSLDSFEYVFDGVPTLLYPKRGYTDEAYAILKKIPNISVWRKDEIPEKFHYGNNPRVGDLVVLPDVGYQVVFGGKLKHTMGGDHGYDNYAPEMEGIFYAFGPSFRQGLKAPTMNNVNLYPIICRLLGLIPSTNDGEEATVDRLVK